MKSILQSDEGSISPLISIYFVVIMSSIFVISNVASIYIARRELINLAESSLAAAAQELDKDHYYYQLPSLAWNQDSSEAFVPIDCKKATEVFQREIQLHSMSEVSSSKIANTPISEPSGTNSDDFQSQDVNSAYSKLATNLDAIRILNFQCDGRELRAQISSNKDLMFTFPALGIRSFENQVEVGISTTYIK